MAAGQRGEIGTPFVIALPPSYLINMAKKEKVQPVAKPLPMKKYKPIPNFGR